MRLAPRQARDPGQIWLSAPFIDAFVIEIIAERAALPIVSVNRPSS
jgi:hypothetical protein